MENIEKELGRYLINIKPVQNNLEYIKNIIELKDKMCELLKIAEKEIQADFKEDLFINFIKIDKVFSLSLHSIEFTYKNEMYLIYNLDENIKIVKF